MLLANWFLNGVRSNMEILNAVWTVGVIAVDIILLIYCRHHYARHGWAPQVKLGIVFGILLMGDIVQRSTIYWWHHLFNHGIKLPLDDFYLELAIGCVFAIAGIFMTIRVLSEAYWGWPSCMQVSLGVIAIAVILVVI